MIVNELESPMQIEFEVAAIKDGIVEVSLTITKILTHADVLVMLSALT